ncbi:MAG TPA: CoA-transferase [Candidatus Limnocylindrales bacterium]|nr:CoA-transferase [Candidatus Limnocylindrales bacterium]
MTVATGTRRELMVVAAGREIRDGEVVFVGMRLPLLGFGLAKATHAPHAVGLFENGVIRDRPAEDFIYTMGDPPNIAGAIACLGLLDVMSLLQQGRVDVGFIGGAEIDPLGNLNTTRAEADGRVVRLPGSGGGQDIASLARRTVLIMEHEPRRFRPHVSYVTSPGHWPGRRRGGPATLITTLGVFDLRGGRFRVESLHPGVGLDEVRAATGFPIEAEASPRTTKPPTPSELAYIRRADPQGFWTGGPS